MRFGVPGRRTAIAVASLALAAAAALGVAVAVNAPGGRIGPSNHIQPTGRKLLPVGKMTRLGNFPTGGALTADGRFLWALSTGRSRNDIRIVRVNPRAGKVVQRIPMPGLSGGIVMAADGKKAYVSGVADSPHADQRVSTNVPGRQGDVIHVFRLNRRNGHARRVGVIEVPPPSSAPAAQSFPPGTDKLSWPRDLAISRDGKTLLAALNLADAAAIIDTRTRAVRYVEVGHYPYGAGITRNGKRGLVTSESEGSVYVIDLASGEVVKQIQVGPHLSHPESIAMDPKRERAYVAVTNQDVIAVLDTKRLRVLRTLSVARPQGTGTFPTYLSVTRDGCDLLSADSGEDAVAIIALSRRKSCGGGEGVRRVKRFGIVGRIPVASYPTVAAATPGRDKLVWVSARGLGVGPNPNGPNPNSPNDSDDHINSFQFLPSIVRGSAGILAFPRDARIRKLTPRASRQIIPTNRRKPPAGTPVRANGPIKHIFYIVKENRTYDQILGDDPRGDGDPGLTIFGKGITPNAHALARRFPLIDHFYGNSEASIDGHYWTAAGAVSDYVVKNWHQNYAGRGRPYDFGGYVVTAPPRGYIFERMIDAGISFFNFGEALAGLSPLPDKDRTQEQTNTAAQVLANSDIQLFGPPPGPCYDSDIANFSSPAGQGLFDVYDSSLPPGAKPGSHSRFDCFNTRFQMQLATDSVPTFTYIVLPLNHTEGVKPGKRTPDAEVASNDWALGQFVDAISHSSIWNSSLILVMEDDSQDGADHVDAHRMPALAISPYTRKGAVVHTRYDQLSMLRTAEIIMGLRPLNLAEALAVPMYEVFNKTGSNSAPYDAIVPNVSMTEVNPNTPANRAASAGLPLNQIDRIPQRRLDAILWRYRHGFDSQPPPPGPNASGLDRHEEGEDEEAEADAREIARELRELYRELVRGRDR